MGRNHELVILELSPDEVQKRFWDRVDRTSDPDGCWPWIAYRGGHGYGRLTVHFKNLLTHRIAYTLANGPIPDGLWVLHRCDNRACCRPDHLWLGTSQENTADRTAKGRTASGSSNGAYTRPDRKITGDQHWMRTRPELVKRGEANPQARLTEDAVRSIRARFASGQATIEEMAREYSFSPKGIEHVVKRNTWKHVA